MLCQAYGTVLQTNVSWPSLSSGQPRPDTIFIQVDRVTILPAAGSPLTTSELQGRTVRILGAFPDLSMQIDDMLLVAFEHKQRRLHCFATENADEALVKYWLLRQIVPIAQLVWNDADLLHAGAVQIGDEAAAFLAPSGTGKSTLVGHFVGSGHKLVTDDHLVLRRGNPGEPVWTLPTVPYYRNYRAMEHLGRYTDQYDPDPCRLKVIYVLKIADPAAEVQASPLSNAEAALELLYQAPYNLINLKFPDALPLARRRFEFIAGLPASVTVKRLDVPRSLDRLPEVAAYITADFHMTGTTHATI